MPDSQRVNWREIQLSGLLQIDRKVLLACGQCGDRRYLAGVDLAVMARWLGRTSTVQDLRDKIPCGACGAPRPSADVVVDGFVRTPQQRARPTRKLPVGWLGETLHDKQSLTLYCERPGCGQSRTLDLEDLVRRYGAQYAIGNLMLKTYCAKCGARWPEISCKSAPLFTTPLPAIGFHPVEPQPPTLAAAHYRGLVLHLYCGGCRHRRVYGRAQLELLMMDHGKATPIEELPLHRPCPTCGPGSIVVAANWPGRDDNFGVTQRAHVAT